MVTDPYRPSVWAMSSNDTPLVVESDQNLPTESASDNRVMRGSKGEICNKNHTHTNIPFTKLQNLSASSERRFQLLSDFERTS